MPVFWLVELDLICLKGSTASSSRFGAVYGFSTSVGSPSGFGSVRHVYSVATPGGPLSIPSLLPAPLSLGSLLVLLSPGPSLHCRPKLARQGLCVDLPSAPQPCPLHPGDWWACLSALSSPSVLWALCMLLSAPGASVCFSGFSRPAIWLGPWSVSCLWAEKCNFLCFLPSRSLLCHNSKDSAAPHLVPPVRERPSAWGLFLLHSSPTPLGAQAPS